jgi:hypothetical protein
MVADLWRGIMVSETIARWLRVSSDVPGSGGQKKAQYCDASVALRVKKESQYAQSGDALDSYAFHRDGAPFALRFRQKIPTQ